MGDETYYVVIHQGEKVRDPARKIFTCICEIQEIVSSIAWYDLTVSYIARPAVTLPPGELIYKWIGFVESSASKNNS